MTSSGERPLFSGSHFFALVQLLSLPSIQQPVDYSSPDERSERRSLATAHILSTPDWSHSNIKFLKTPSEMNLLLDENSSNGVLFLRGYPSAEWLSHLGRRFDLEYDFLYGHFAQSFQLHVGDDFCFPPLSVHGSDMIQLVFTSIGTAENYNSSASLTEVRRSVNLEMRNYVAEFSKGNLTMGDSVIRDFHLHDLNHFSIEQKISLQLVKGAKVWTLLIWTDCGMGLHKTRSGPLWKMHTVYGPSMTMLPIVSSVKNQAIDRTLDTRNTQGEDGKDALPSEQDIPNVVEPLLHLHKELGISLNSRLAHNDPFYMLDEIFRLFVTSEYQFLNLMHAKVDELAHFDTHRPDSTSELKRIKELVNKHAERIEDLIPVIKARGGDWPRAPGETRSEQKDPTKEYSEQLTVLFDKVLRRARAVSELCQFGISDLGNEMTIREARRSKKQAGVMAKITVVAFVLGCLSFTTSFFGMNFMELDGSKRSIWLWFAVSVPVLLGSWLAWRIDGSKCKNLMVNIKERFAKDQGKDKESRGKDEEIAL
ncbi:hypothetical protein AK830_g1365 [Neonectria ditissima]|uniref:Uncharacterized protein n=1 Tax=Neonectria ditissima TaxID=78410 RepID=A0A0P7BJ51_9HYPO|nr:hypothetical protein AK830_g1365 [Neonectria ditissima]